jgi:molecular chaperone GrpE
MPQPILITIFTRSNFEPVMKKKKKLEEQDTATKQNEEKNTVTEEGEAQQEETSPLKEMEDKYNEMHDKYMRLYSEFDNFRKRTQKEKLELYKTAGEDVIQSLLPVIDDFERAEKSIAASEDFKSLKEGVDLIYQKLINTLQQKGLKPITSAVGENFDLEFHEAITKVKAPDEKLKGKIIDEVEKGYLLNEKVIRFTKVVVGE